MRTSRLGMDTHSGKDASTQFGEAVLSRRPLQARYRGAMVEQTDSNNFFGLLILS